MGEDPTGPRVQSPEARAIRSGVAVPLTMLVLRQTVVGLLIATAGATAARWSWVGWVFAALCVLAAIPRLTDGGMRRAAREEAWRRWEQLPQSWLEEGERFRVEVSEVATRLGAWAAGARIAVMPERSSRTEPVPGAPDESLRWDELYDRLARRGSWAVLGPSGNDVVLLIGHQAAALPEDQRRATEAWALDSAGRWARQTPVSRLRGIGWLVRAGAFAVLALVGPAWWLGAVTMLIVVVSTWAWRGWIIVRTDRRSRVASDREAARVTGPTAVVAAILALDPTAAASPESYRSGTARFFGRRSVNRQRLAALGADGRG